MAKNYMADVARMLGVELEEEFHLKDSSVFYKIVNKGLYYKFNTTWYPSSNDLFVKLIMGEVEIVKLPWQPKKGERYYTPSIDFSHTLIDYWDGYPLDFALKEAGMAFKTKEECEAALPELRKKYLGGDDNV